MGDVRDMSKKLIGKRAYIKSNVAEEYRSGSYWGTIIDFDGEYYHIQMLCNGVDETSPALIFERHEFVVKRDKAK